MFTDYIAEMTATFIDPRKRVFVGYLLLAVFIAVSWVCFYQRRSFRDALALLFSPAIWLSSSAKLDYLLLVINKALMLLLSPMLLAQLTLASAIFYGCYELFGQRTIVLAEAPDWVIALLFTTIYFLLDDFFRFFIHRLMHRWPWLWAFHKVHHSATVLTPLTIFRTHPVEAIIFVLRSSCVQGVVIGALVFFLGDRADIMTVLGANVVIFIFNLVGSNLRHSHVAIHYSRSLELIFMSPAQHQIHHSVDACHYDKNFGVVLSVWDRLFGSHHFSQKQQTLRFGLDASATEVSHSLWSAYIVPFVESAGCIKQAIFRLTRCCRLWREQRIGFRTPTINKVPK